MRSKISLAYVDFWFDVPNVFFFFFGKSQSQMPIVSLLTFVADTDIISSYNFGAPFGAPWKYMLIASKILPKNMIYQANF